MIKKTSMTVLLGCALLFPVNAEKVNLSVYASNLDSIAITVLPFKNTGEAKLAKDEPWKVIANDLDFSGRFTVFRSEKADSVEMVKNNIPLYVDGEFEVFGQYTRVTCALRESKSGSMLVEKKYERDMRHIRSAGHEFANQLVEMLFNEKGIFESRILYVKDDGVKKNIMLMDWDGDNLQAVTANSTINIYPTFIDSMSFLYTSFLRGHPNIYKGVIGGKSVYMVPSRFTDTSPAYSPITGKIAFASSRDGNMEIYSCDFDGSNIKRLTSSRSIETAPCWSPNGYQIAFTSDRAGNPQIFIMDADGGNVHRLYFGGGYQDSPAWSPKGDKIAFHMLSGGKFDVWTAAPDGSKPFQVTSVPGNNEYPAWAADGDHVAFSSERAGKYDLYGIKADGTHLKRLTNSGKAKMPDWSMY
jgi:TolB protein